MILSKIKNFFYASLPDIIYLNIILLSLIIFWPKFSGLLINSDSYAIMLPAKFLTESGSFYHQLGQAGDIFSPIFYRGGFSLFIYILAPLLNNNWFLSSQFIIQFSYFASILLLYFSVKKIFSSSVAGFLSSLLLTFCYTYHHWATVLMSEIPTIFLLVLSIFLLLQKNSWSFYLSAIILGISYTFRAEMILLLIPLYFLVDTVYPQDKTIKIIYSIFSLSVWVIYLFFLYQFNPSSDQWSLQQLNILYFTIGSHHLFFVLLLLIVLIIIIFRYWPILSIIPASIGLYVFLKLNLDWQHILPPLQSFLLHDFFIILAGIAGLIFLYRQKKIFYFVISYFFLLFSLYFTRGEYRYYVHTIIPLVISASYVLSEIVSSRKTNPFLKIIYPSLVVLLLIGQLYLFLQPTFLPATSYEQVVIEETKNLINSKMIDQQNLLVCSVFSEAVYFSTDLSAQDCFNGLEDIKRNPGYTKLLIIDEDISRHQPEFTDYLTQNYSNNLIYQKWLITPYIENNNTSIPQYPVKWYLIN